MTCTLPALVVLFGAISGSSALWHGIYPNGLLGHDRIPQATDPTVMPICKRVVKSAEPKYVTMGSWKLPPAEPDESPSFTVKDWCVCYMEWVMPDQCGLLKIDILDKLYGTEEILKYFQKD